MKIITRAVLDMNTMQWLPEQEESFEYSGPLARCDRGAQSAAKAASGTAKDTATNAGEEAKSELGEVQPFFQQEMKAQHGYTPGQTDELLTAAGAGTGGATGALTGEADLQAARTRNASGFTKSLDEMARDKQKALAGTSEGVAAQDVNLAKQENQEGAQGEAGLYGINNDAMLKSMGIQNQDINTQIEAGKSGWLQNMNQTLTAVGALASGLKPKP